jgi:hypothetical protein
VTRATSSGASGAPSPAAKFCVTLRHYPPTPDEDARIAVRSRARPECLTSFLPQAGSRIDAEIRKNRITPTSAPMSTPGCSRWPNIFPGRARYSYDRHRGRRALGWTFSDEARLLRFNTGSSRHWRWICFRPTREERVRLWLWSGPNGWDRRRRCHDSPPSSAPRRCPKSGRVVLLLEPDPARDRARLVPDSEWRQPRS